MTEEDTAPTLERERTVNVAWIFDIDGVVTDPETKEPNPVLITAIAKKANAQEPVALVTGRALKWVSERVLPQIESQIDNPTLLDNFFVSGEFGGVYITYENGIRKHVINSGLSVPNEVIEKARELIEYEFSDSMFVDPDKETMFSVEMNDGLTVAQFKPRQAELLPKLEEILNNHPKKDELEVHGDRIASNIKDKKANKGYATEQVINWLKKRNVAPKQFFAFGDALSDTEIAQEIAKNNLPVTFVFVGERKELAGVITPYPIVFTYNNFDKGTLEFLQTQTL